MITQTKDTQAKLNPKDALNILIDGNKRFIAKNKEIRDLNEQVNITNGGQFPFAVVLSCIDSRVPIELVFDQGIGDVFSARVAGNIINEDILGSIEYGCKVAGSKVVLVLGHTKCGAVTAACKDVKLGNITPLLEKITPAVDAIKSENSGDLDIEAVAIKNVQMSIDRIRKESPILAEMEQENTIEIVGGIYDVSSGKVNFL